LQAYNDYNNWVDIGIALRPYLRAMDLTPQAKKLWDAIAPDQRLWILNHVWCVNCMKPSSMGSVRGHVDKGVLSLKGVCTRCNGLVARIVEQP
jgi:hypothetical protein